MNTRTPCIPGFGLPIVLLLAFIACGAQSTGARDAFVLISGGNSPMDNNYSQYLQARGVATCFERSYPTGSVWVFFGAGNVEGEAPKFGDVRRRTQREGLMLDSWLAGPLLHNRPARREVILRAFREEILPAVAGGGTLFLFVGDHGERPRGADAESLINLWSLERDPKSEHGWRASSKESLGVAELRRTLAKGLGKGRVVFCMTQCHSGGFHYLAMPHTMTPNPRWFTVAPAWAASREQPVFPRVAGFAATDEYSSAAGCDPAPSVEEWAGYERFIPERLFGIDLFTLERTSAGLRSFAEAHAAATLVDRTIDNPYSTSEQYLERWSNLIETRLAKETNLTAKVKSCVAAYQRTMDGAVPKVADRAFCERQELFRQFIDRLAGQNPSTKGLLLTGTGRELEEAAKPGRREQAAGPTPQRAPNPGPPPRAGRRAGGVASPELRKLWDETLRPAWKKAVDSNQAARVLGAALDFEKYLLGLEAKGRDLFFARRGALQDEVFWHSGYSDPQTVDLARAEAIVRWGIERRGKIVTWAKAEEDEALRAAAEKLAPARPQRRPAVVVAPRTASEPVGRKTAAERALFYRRVLAAWEFLIAVNERSALTRLREFTELERTPLPKPRVN